MKYKKINTELIDKTTGELFTLNELLNDLSTKDFEEVIQRFLIAKEIYTEINNSYRVIESQFLNKMNSIDAKKYKNNEVEISLTSQAEYDYDVKIIDELSAIINSEDFNKTFTKKYKVNRTHLKSLKILGGNIKDLIDKMETKIERKPTIIIKRKL